MINTDSPAISLTGYQITLTYDAPPNDCDIAPDTMYLYRSGLQLEAAFMTHESIIKRMPLNHLTAAPTILTTLQKRAPYLSLQHEHDVLNELDCHRQGLIVSYVDGTQASDTDIANKIIDIYLKTRNIIADAYVLGNFLHDATNGNITCVDVDHAFHRDSPVSQLFLGVDPYAYFLAEYNIHTIHYPKTIIAIKTLFYMEKHLLAGEILDLYITPRMIAKLHVLCEQGQPLTAGILQQLSQEPEAHQIPTNTHLQSNTVGVPGNQWIDSQEEAEDTLDAFLQTIADEIPHMAPPRSIVHPTPLRPTANAPVSSPHIQNSIFSSSLQSSTNSAPSTSLSGKISF